MKQNLINMTENILICMKKLGMITQYDVKEIRDMIYHRINLRKDEDKFETKHYTPEEEAYINGEL